MSGACPDDCVHCGRDALKSDLRIGDRIGHLEMRLADAHRDITESMDEAAWWKEATEIKREQAKKLRALSARRGRELKEARAELKRLRALVEPKS